MEKQLFIFLLVTFSLKLLSAQHTFSIVAVDTITGEVGSAGATCLDENQEGVGAVIISDVIPGVGAIHTQSYLDPTNKNNARRLLAEGRDPVAIIDWLVNNDARRSPFFRQYGVAVLNPTDGIRSAAYTGSSSLPAKGHLTGRDYAIQGNILLDEEVLEKMEEGYVNTEGSLAERLLASMLAAKIPGADSRCLFEGVSSRSAFLRLAKPDDASNNLSIDIQVNSTPFGIEPLEVLKERFELQTTSVDSEGNQSSVNVFPNPSKGSLVIEMPFTSRWQIELFDAKGSKVFSTTFMGKIENSLNLPDLKGIFILKIKEQQRGGAVFTQKILMGV